MRVEELLEDLQKPIPDLSQSKHLLSIQHKQFNPKWEKMGAPGQQAAAFLKPSSNTVIKEINITGNNDPTYQFLRMIKKHQDNPYFPKVYSMKVYPLEKPDDRFHYKMIISMERLYRLEEPMYPMVASKLGFRFDQPRDVIAASRQLVNQQFGSQEWRKQVIRTTQDANLKQAMRLLEPLFRHYGNDMHLKNIMYRKDRGMPQLVFADPIAPPSQS